jgi:ketosteroid isomerase-like protein
MAMRRLALAVLSSVVLAACQPVSTELTEERRSAIEEDIARAFDDYAIAVRQLDQEAVLGFFQQSDDLAFAEFGEVVLSWSTLAERVRESWPMYASVESFGWGDLHIQALAPHIAVANTTFDFAAADTAGAPISVKGTFTTVWVDTDGAWKIVSLAETFPAPETSSDET